MKIVWDEHGVAAALGQIEKRSSIGVESWSVPTIMKFVEELCQEGYQDEQHPLNTIYEAGREDGNDNGYDEGYSQGWDDAQEGKEEE